MPRAATKTRHTQVNKKTKQKTALDAGVRVTLCASSKNGDSLSAGLVEFLRSNPTGFQSRILCGLLLSLLDSQAVKPDVRLRTFALVIELLWYNSYPVCGSPTQQVWDLILSQSHPSCYLLVASLSLDVEYLVGRFYQ